MLVRMAAMNNLPAMTEEQRQELIRHNRAKVNAITPQFLKESTPGVKKHLQREIDSAKIAIAALTAEPKAFLLHDVTPGGRSSWVSLTGVGGIDPDDVNEYEITQEPLYTAPPTPVLRVPVDFSALDRLAGKFLQASVERGGRVSSAYAECAHLLATEVKLLRAAGYEVKQ